jgi:hypothetical protein
VVSPSRPDRQHYRSFEHRPTVYRDMGNLSVAHHGMGQGIAQEVHAAALPGGFQHLL